MAAFVATNIDNLLLLMLFFSHVDTTFRKRHIVVGHYIGFAALIGMSVLGFLGTRVIPARWIGLLGVVPMAVGITQLMHQAPAEARHDASAPQQLPTPQQRSFLGNVLRSHVYRGAVVTIANGRNNLSMYMPLFANGSASRMGIFVLVFFVLVGVWCYIGYKLKSHPAVADVLDQTGQILVPFVFIGVGIFILVESGAITLFLERPY